VVFRRTECGYASSKWVQLGAAVVAVGSAAASGLALFAAITAQPVDGVYALWMGGVCVLMARTALLKVEVRREGVQVVNLWRTDLVPLVRLRWLRQQAVARGVSAGRLRRPTLWPSHPRGPSHGGRLLHRRGRLTRRRRVLDLEDRVRAVSTP